LLKIDANALDADTVGLREQYTKIALLMFYPFHRIEDLKIEDSFWKLFDQQRTMHVDNKKTTFWSKEVLKSYKTYKIK